ncbi:MAG: hypothetical protein R3C19_18570 [Planctomycetaceae bacterium]
MQNDDDGLAGRIGRKVNELDIDFSRFTVAGWLVVLATVGNGVLAGWLAFANVRGRNAMDNGPALLIGLSGLVAAILTFFGLRWILGRLGVRIVRGID